MANRTTNSYNTILNKLIETNHTLLECPVHFSGEYGEQKIHQFIAYIEAFKKIKNISNEQALLELGYLLTEHAHTWWLRRKCHFKTWPEALTALQNQYAKQRPAYLIYKDIIQHPFKEYSLANDFIDDKYELLTELADPKLTEKNKLDIILALLPKDKQLKLPCFNILNIAQLKEQLEQLNHNRNILNSHVVEVKKELLDDEEVMAEKRKHGRIEETSCEILKSNNNEEPLLKLRRTEDLMPQVKSKPIEVINKKQQNGVTNNVQSEEDIMNIIMSIMNETEINGLATNQIELPLNEESQIPRKVKLRCEYCRKINHAAETCHTKARHVTAILEKVLTYKKSAETVKVIDDDNSNSSECDVKLNIIESAASLITHQATLNDVNDSNIRMESVASLFQDEPEPTVKEEYSDNETPKLDVTTNILSTVETNVSSIPSTENLAIASTLPTYSDSASLPSISLASRISNTTLASSLSSSSSALNHNTPSLTIKLISPMNGPSANKNVNAKARTINDCSPKCHQCGLIGYYKSICPNCSPIYNTNQKK